MKEKILILVMALALFSTLSFAQMSGTGEEETKGEFKPIPTKTRKDTKFEERVKKLRVNMTRSALYSLFRNYKRINNLKEGNEEWITFGEYMSGRGSNRATIYLKKGVVKGWKVEE